MSLYSSSKFVVLPLLVLFWAKEPLSFVAKAQEAPRFTTELYDPIFNYRSNVCDRHRLYHSGEVAFRDTLQGLELTAMLGVGNLFQLREDETIDPQYPGLFGVLMDELALRAGFTWRNSYAVYYTPGENKTYTNLVQWGSDSYDVMVDWWNTSVERLQMGIGFPEGFYDASYILIGLQGGDDSSTKVDLFNFLRPFSMTLWWAILGTTIVSILAYMVIEGSPNNEAWNVGWNLYLGILMFTQHFSYEPVSPPGRLFGASMAFWSLLIIVAYTANLASFFVAQNTPRIQINSIDDAIRANMRICTWDAAASGAYAKAQYPQGIFIGKETEQESLMAVKTGECDLCLMSLKSWEQYESDRDYNGDCDLAWVGRVVKFVEAGFAVKNDAGIKCTSLVHDVLNMHLVEMQGEGFIDNAWTEFFARSRDLDCSAETNDEEESLDDLQLTLSQMAGTFIVHACAGAFAILMAVGTFLRRKWMERKDRMNIGDGMRKAEKEPTFSLLNLLSSTEHERDDFSKEYKESEEDTSSLSDLQEKLHDLHTTQEDTNNNLKNLSAAQETQKEEMAKMMTLLKAMYRKQATQERSQSQSLLQLRQLSQSDHLRSQSELENLN